MTTNNQSRIRKRSNDNRSLISAFRREIREELESAGFDDDAVEDALGELERRKFYSVATVLAADPAAREVLREKAVDGFTWKLSKATGLPLDSENVGLLKQLFTAIAKDDEAKVKRLLSDPAFREFVVESIAKRYSFPLEDAREALELLKQGVFRQDLVGVTRMTLQLAREVPGWLPSFIPRPSGLKAIAKAFYKDGMDHYFLGRAIVKDLKNKRVPDLAEKDLGVFDDTLRSLTDNMESLDDLCDWSANVLDRPGVQLSIAIYASLHGLPVKAEEVVALQKCIATRDLNPLVHRLMVRTTDKAKKIVDLGE